MGTDFRGQAGRGRCAIFCVEFCGPTQQDSTQKKKQGRPDYCSPVPCSRTCGGAAARSSTSAPNCPTTPQEGRTCYAASKRGHPSLHPERINVNCVWPSAVTPSWLRSEAVDPEGVERVLEAEMAFKRRGDPEMDVGRAAVFSDWVTGQTLGANGGRTFV